MFKKAYNSWHGQCLVHEATTISTAFKDHEVTILSNVTTNTPEETANMIRNNFVLTADQKVSTNFLLGCLLPIRGVIGGLLNWDYCLRLFSQGHGCFYCRVTLFKSMSDCNQMDKKDESIYQESL